MLAYSAGQIRDVPTSIIATVNENMIFKGTDLNFEDIMSCYQEEADRRLILHVHDRCRKSYKKLAIVGSDIDIAIVALFHFYDLNVKVLNDLNVKVEYDVRHKQLQIHEYAKCLEEKICRALLFWLAITGCDTLSAFSGLGKKITWDAWNVSEEATGSFLT